MITATIIFIAALGALACWLLATQFELSDVKRERDCAFIATRTRDEEITHLRKVQAAKIDRALFMLVAIRAKRLGMSERHNGIVRVTLDISDVMHIALTDQNEGAVEGMRELLAQHIARRVDKVTS